MHRVRRVCVIMGIPAARARGRWGAVRQCLTQVPGRNDVPFPLPPSASPLTIGRMSRGTRHPLITGTVITSLGTLACRVLGMLRDMATAWLLGLGGVADAFWFAFRIPNLFRQLFGEGAMTASSLPVLTSHLETDPGAARQLASVVVTLLALFLAGVVAAGELLCGLVWLIWGHVPGVGLLMGLSAVMLPYLLLICVAAQLTTMLYSARHFTVPALSPALLNIVWLAAAWAAARWFADNQVAQAYLLAAAVLLAGAAQVAVQLPTLRRLGFHFDYNWSTAREGSSANWPQPDAHPVRVWRSRRSTRLTIVSSPGAWPRRRAGRK